MRESSSDAALMLVDVDNNYHDVERRPEAEEKIGGTGVNIEDIEDEKHLFLLTAWPVDRTHNAGVGSSRQVGKWASGH